MPKVFAAREAMMTGAFGVASLFFGYVAETYGIVVVFMLAAQLSFLSGLWAYIRRKYLCLKKV